MGANIWYTRDQSYGKYLNYNVRKWIVDESTVFVINHFSHNGETMLHEELSEVAEKEGFIVAYNGMTMEV